MPRLPEDARLPADLVAAGPAGGGAAVAVAERALREAQAVGDRRAEARARRALGEALVAEGDPAGREELEDAGTLFEELGDEAAVLGIDAALREIDRRSEVSPRSFAGRRRRA